MPDKKDYRNVMHNPYGISGPDVSLGILEALSEYFSDEAKRVRQETRQDKREDRKENRAEKLEAHREKVSQNAQERLNSDNEFVKGGAQFGTSIGDFFQNLTKPKEEKAMEAALLTANTPQATATMTRAEAEAQAAQYAQELHDKQVIGHLANKMYAEQRDANYAKLKPMLLDYHGNIVDYAHTPQYQALPVEEQMQMDDLIGNLYAQQYTQNMQALRGGGN